MLYDNPLELYEYLLLGPLCEIYKARKKSKLYDWQIYSNLLIDKFAIHSSSFFHISKGIIERKKSSVTLQLKGYDLFTINTTIRAMIETYVTFNHLFVEPKNSDESHFRYLLWKLDGLFQERKYDIKSDDFDGLAEFIEYKEKEINSTIDSITNSIFFKQISKIEISKIFNPTKKTVNWRFAYDGSRVLPLKIIELVKHCCKTRAFVNTYKHSSLHTHSNYPSLNEFKSVRSRLLSTEYTDPITRLSIYLTCLIITDICEIDKNSEKKLKDFPLDIRELITRTSYSIKESK